MSEREVRTARVDAELDPQRSAEGELRVEPVGGDDLGGGAAHLIEVVPHRADATSGHLGFRPFPAVTRSAYPLRHKGGSAPRNANTQGYARADGEGPVPRPVRGARLPGRPMRPSAPGRPAVVSAAQAP